MFDKVKAAARAFLEFWGPDPKTEPAHFEHWICQGTAADGTEFEHEGGWVLVSGLRSRDAIEYLMDGIARDGYFRDATVVFPLATVTSADWRMLDDMDGPIPYDKFDFQIVYTYSEMMKKIAAGRKLQK